MVKLLIYFSFYPELDVEDQLLILSWSFLTVPRGTWATTWCIDRNINKGKQIQEDASISKFIFSLEFTLCPHGSAMDFHLNSEDIVLNESFLSRNTKYFKTVFF